MYFFTSRLHHTWTLPFSPSMEPLVSMFFTSCIDHKIFPQTVYTAHPWSSQAMWRKWPSLKAQKLYITTSSASEPTQLVSFSPPSVSCVFSRKFSLYPSLIESSLSLWISNFLHFSKISLLYVLCSWRSLSFLVHIFYSIYVPFPPYKKA